jgi:hypothetical protein
MSYTKIIQSGNIIEKYEYEKDFIQFKRRANRRGYTSFTYATKRRTDNVHRLGKQFKRLVWANLTREETAYLFTLTFVEEKNIKRAYQAFTAFNTRLRRRIREDYRYIVVPEFQKRGTVHFHVLVWGLDKYAKNERNTRAFQNLWGYGYVDVIETDNSPRLSGYLAKYMSKAMHDKRLRGQKAYRTSRNIMRPTLLNTKTQTMEFSRIWGLDKTTIPDKTHKFDTMWLGECNYSLYIN